MRVAPPFRETVATVVVALSMLAIAHEPAAPQAPAPQPSLSLQEQGSPPAAPTPEPSPEKSGLIDEMGKLFKQIIPPMKSPGEAIDELNARASDALSRLKPGAMVKGRIACPATAGTPDCKSGADKLCQSKGGRQEPRHRFLRDLLGEGSDPGTVAQTRRLPHRYVCDDGALPVA